MTPLPITWRHDADYERARIGRVFNYCRPSRYPIAVVEASEESHVDEAVRLAIQEQCRISIRSGGHSWAAWSVRDDAVLLDLGRFKEIELDEKAGIVKVSPSITGRELNDRLQTKGVMFAGGHCPNVGLGGFLLQGGMGWNCKVPGALTISYNDVDFVQVVVLPFLIGSCGMFSLNLNDR